MYLRESSELREDRAYDCGCNSWSLLMDAVGSLRKELIRLWNSILPESGQPSPQLSKLIRLTAYKKTNHTVSRWYRTVYIPRLVASYDTHKGKRWLNSHPPKPQGGRKSVHMTVLMTGHGPWTFNITLTQLFWLVFTLHSCSGLYFDLAQWSILIKRKYTEI